MAVYEPLVGILVAARTSSEAITKQRCTRQYSKILLLNVTSFSKC